MMTLDIDITGVGRISFIIKLPTRLLHILSCFGPLGLQRPKYMGHPILSATALCQVQIHGVRNPIGFYSCLYP